MADIRLLNAPPSNIGAFYGANPDTGRTAAHVSIRVMDGPPIPAPPVTVSPRIPVGDLCRLVQARLDRDGVVELVAASQDGRQLSQLRRVARRLAADGFHCSQRDEKGGIVLTVIPRAGYAVAWYPGTPKV
jgi:hypothetical protein